MKLVFLISFFVLAFHLFGAEKRQKKKLKHLPDDIEELEQAPINWFPDWPVPQFGWSLGPIVGATYSENEADTKQFIFEIGATAGLRGVPLYPSNPGLVLEPMIGLVFGDISQTSIDENGKRTDTENIGYRRLWTEVDLILLLHFYRHILGVGFGTKAYDEDRFRRVKSFSVKNDFGVLLRTWISTHFTHRYLKAYENSFGDPFLTENDFWLHTRFFTELMNAYFDLGPGFTIAEEHLVPSGTNEGRADYFKSLVGLNPFWRIVLSGSAKYVYQSTDDRLGNFAETKLPHEGLYDSPSVIMPEDSYVATIFVGINRLFGGFGVGWQTNIQVLNVSEKDGRHRQSTTDQGLVLTYGSSF